MKNYTLEVKIAEKGTLYNGTEIATFGHVYYVLVEQYGNRKSFGWGMGKSSILGGAENIGVIDKFVAITPHFESSPSTRCARFLKPCRGFN